MVRFLAQTLANGNNTTYYANEPYTNGGKIYNHLIALHGTDKWATLTSELENLGCKIKYNIYKRGFTLTHNKVKVNGFTIKWSNGHWETIGLYKEVFETFSSYKAAVAWCKKNTPPKKQMLKTLVDSK